MLEEILQVVEHGFADKKVMVIGDLMLDKYILGNVSRVSPEAPVPVIKAENQEHTLGGAGNVALNLAGLDISIFLIGLVGSDQNGRDVKGLLAGNGRISQYVLTAKERPTTTKTRIVGENQQIARVDQENAEPLPEHLENAIVENIDAVFTEGVIDAIILSDYAKGLLTPKICIYLIDEANKYNIPVIVDPKGKNYNKYRNATILMPNESELATACNTSLQTNTQLKDAARQLSKELNVDYLVVTRGAEGISLITKEYDHDIPTRAREVFDVSGAGDTVIALASAGLIMGLTIEKSLELANFAAGYVVRKFGTHPITYTELNDIIHRQLSSEQKFFRLEDFINRLKYWRDKNQKVVFTNGCFDIIHAGHIHLLNQAKKQGDKLVVAINTDKSVAGLKGDNRPVNTLKDRVSVLEAITYIDAIIAFDESTPLKLIEQTKPDILVKGADYEENEIAGAEEVKLSGGNVVLIPLLNGKSTSRMINQVTITNA